ncbi:glycosyltransferase family 2 protein [Rutstroemia sp. NJR-2017a BBW]|nr:glycosyltransferase family 2 protein [Rutstroemia sp. NJR-2017a BBW]
MAWLFIAAEGCVACPALLHQLYQMLSIRGRSRPKLRIRGDEVPTVDVFITCCGEDVDVVLDTTRAAAAVDYPQDRFRVVVLDDGKDAELEKAVNDLSLDYPNVYYYARIKIKGVPHHFKAGNLTGGTNYVTTLEGGEAEFIAALDADMIPEPDWLRAIIAHMVIDDKMALVCPPQLFYNVPENDPLCQSLDAFVHVMEPTKDANGVAWCTGSGYAIRRSALEDIGGWPVGSLAEDTFTSSLLLGAGWKTAFCHEGLQFGTVPDTITGHLKQRTRWTLGTLQTALKLRFCLWGPLVKGMGFFARLSAFVFAIDAFFKIFLLIALLTIPIVLISGGQLVAYSTDDQLKWQIRFCFASLVLTRLNEWITYIPSGYRLAQRDSGAQMWMAPFHAKTIIRSFILPSWLGGKAMAFSSSGSIKSELNERDPKTRAGLFRRLWVVLWDCGCYMHLLYILFVIAAVTLSTVDGMLDSANNTLKKKLVYMLTHACWPPMLWMMCLTACFEPIRYAIWPPNMPEREELLDRDPKTGIARPKEEWKKQSIR